MSDTEDLMDPRPRRLREALGLSLRAAAAGMGINWATLDKLEKGRRPWAIQHVTRWLKFMQSQVKDAQLAGHTIPRGALPSYEEFAEMSERVSDSLRAQGASRGARQRRKQGGKRGARRQVRARAGL